jgi:hypothetical protein
MAQIALLTLNTAINAAIMTTIISNKLINFVPKVGKMAKKIVIVTLTPAIP